jgi:hypothetical protein
MTCRFVGAPEGIRTPNLLIRSPDRTRRGRVRTRQMVSRTGIDIATIPDLDELIDQIRSAVAVPDMP